MPQQPTLQSQPMNATTLAHARASTAVQPQRPGGEAHADSDDLALFMRKSRNVSTAAPTETTSPKFGNMDTEALS